MNEFEKKINALRLQFKAEQRQITKDCYRTISRINKDLGQVNSPEAREALRSEKERIYESMRRSHELNKTCYLQQLEMLNDQIRIHFEKTPSKRHLRRMMALLCSRAESDGQKDLAISFGDHRTAKISFE